MYSWCIRTVVTVSLLMGMLAGSPRAEIECSAATSSSITLSWITPGDDGSVGIASQYDIRYARFPITNETWSLATRTTGAPIPRTAGQRETFVIDGLSESTVYYFAIKTADEVPNWSPLSPMVCRRTLAVGQTTAPMTIRDLGVIPER